MKEYFYLGVLLAIPIFLAVWLGYMLWHSFTTIISDWMLNQELDELEADGKIRRKKRREESRLRLDNGCDHEFDGGYGAFPINTCSKCGIEKKKPTGPCDHHWIRVTGPIPGSQCEKCSKQFGGAGFNDDEAE